MANLTIGSLDSENASAASSCRASTSASTSCPDYHDIFINHRGPDVKKGFASHLYRRLRDQGLSVFLDREELEEGHNISSQIENAIRSASVHVAILSPTYAQSRWCLDELVLMKNSGAFIFPVFYKVDPSVVRWTDKDKDGAFAEALRQLEQKTTNDSETGKEKPRYSSDTIQNWRNALSHVADLSGFVHGAEDDEGELLENVVEAVLKKVPKTLLDVAKYPTGLDIRLEDLEKTVLSQWQEKELGEAKVVGIVGAGGLGKTTLAKQFFNLRSSDYNSSSFVFDVRENARTMSLAYLQNKLLGDLMPGKDIKIQSRDEGIGILKKYLSSCHVLIVLDDVDHVDQLEAFLPIKKILKPDSLILVTSRDKHVLETSGVLESSIYSLKGMDAPHSKELFCCHAFHQPDPVPDFADLVDQFVKACGGLPLSLKVFGALVFGQNENYWREILDKLYKVLLSSEIYDRLKISYKSLKMGKEIFLDIACFFLGEDGDKAKRIWGEVGVRNLQDKCLLELDENNKIKMHDHIRDMGRKIAEKGSKPLRLWDWTINTIDDLLEQSSTVITKVHGIKMVSYSYDIFRNAENMPYAYFYDWDKISEMRHLFSSRSLEIRLKNLSLVAAKGGYLDDILRRVQSPNLIWLRWYGCPYSSLPSWLPMENLRVLEVEGSGLNILWSHQSQAVPLQLRELNIWAPLSDIPKSIGQLKYLERIAIWQNSKSRPTVARLPAEFSDLRSLKYLVLKDFSRLMSLPDSFGKLRNLQYIDLEGASNLQMLPNSFGDLTQLKHLFLKRCSNLTISSEALGNITTLESLDLSYCNQVKDVPPHVTRQLSLQKLYLNGSKLKELPSNIGVLCNLEDLQLGSDLLEALPDGLGDLNSLKSLSLSSSPQLKSLPDSIGLLTQLRELVIGSCGLESLPKEILKMNNLKSLSIRNCPLREHPFRKEFEGVRETHLLLEGESALNNLNSSNNRRMFGLKSLTLSRTEIREVFFDEGVFPSVQQLYVEHCPEIRELSVEQLVSLEKLEICLCPKLQSISGLRQLTQLTELYVYGCPEIRELPGVEQLVSLEKLIVLECPKLQSISGLRQLTQLTELHVSGCLEIRELPGVEQLISLQKLIVSHWPKLQSISGLRQLTQFTELYVYGCLEIRELPGVEQLISLQKLNVAGCEKLQSIPGLGQLTQLTELHVCDCGEIRELQGVEQLVSLEKLKIRECQKLQSIPGLGQLTQLTELVVSGCREILVLPGVEHLTSLEDLNVSNCQKLQSIPELGQLTRLTELNVHGRPEIRELPCVRHLTNLKKLDVGECHKLQSIPGLGQLTQLTELHVRDCGEIRELQGVGQLTSLKKLDVSGCEKLQSIPGLGQLTQLTILNARGCREIVELAGVEHLTSLQMLEVGGHEKLQTVPELGQLTHLRELHVHGYPEILELPGLVHLTSLTKLDVGGCENLRSIPGLGQLTQLTELHVRGCREIRELPGVEHLDSLEKLDVGGCEKLQRITGLGQLKQLTELHVRGCCEIQELPGVEHLIYLEKLDVGGCEKLQSIPGLGQLTQLTELYVRGCREILALTGVEHLTSLKKLDLCGCQKFQSIPGLGNLTNLTELDVDGCREILELPDVEHLMSLERLSALECPKLQWSEVVVEQLSERLKDEFKYEKQRNRSGCLQFLQYLCEMFKIDYNSGRD